MGFLLDSIFVLGLLLGTIFFGIWAVACIYNGAFLFGTFIGGLSVLIFKQGIMPYLTGDDGGPA